MTEYKCSLCGGVLKKQELKVIGNIKYTMYRCEKCNRSVAKSD